MTTEPTPHTPEQMRIAKVGNGNLELPLYIGGRAVAALKFDGLLSDAVRIRDSYNACAGINPDAVPELLEALEKLNQSASKLFNNIESAKTWTNRRTKDLHTEIEVTMIDITNLKEHLKQARAALAKAKGETQ